MPKKVQTILVTNEQPDVAIFRPDRNGIRKVLGDLEADVMEYVWLHSVANPQGLTVREVYEAFRQTRIIAYTTVMSTMARLATKHILRATKLETAYMYQPNLSKAEFIDNFVSRILEDLLISFSDTTQIQLERLMSEDSTQRIVELKAKIARLRISE